MVRVSKLMCALSLAGVFAWADALDDKIKNIIGEQSYQSNASFLNKIFTNKNMYYTSGRLDIAKIVYALKSNGLLSSRFGQPNEVKLSFSARTSPVLLTKIGNNILTSMGYSYFVVSKAEFTQGLSSIEFSFTTEHSPDMGIIIDELGRRGFACLDIKRLNAQAWDYTLEVLEPRLPNTSFLSKGAKVSLREGSGEYWLNVRSEGELSIQGVDNLKWNPRIVLYDKNLGIIDMLLNRGNSNTFKIKVTKGTRFVMITDYDAPEHLKSGIVVELK